ncbi:MAG: hypothetical protein F6K41_17680, partial [Symploca sp. SIO3E6]|nr:hypothetical protein [Caldora sp. SIO3E6]
YGGEKIFFHRDCLKISLSASPRPRVPASPRPRVPASPRLFQVRRQESRFSILNSLVIGWKS